MSVEVFLEFLGFFETFFVALMNYLAISRFFFSQKYFLKIKKKSFCSRYSSFTFGLLLLSTQSPKVWFCTLDSSFPHALQQPTQHLGPNAAHSTSPARGRRQAGHPCHHPSPAVPELDTGSRPAPPGLCLGVRDTTKPRPYPYKTRRPSRVS
jgi:hypothetical protein